MTEQAVLFEEEAQPRTDMQEVLATRRQFRCAKRNRKNRYWPCWLLHPRKSEGWLALCVWHLVKAHLKTIRPVHRLLPVWRTAIAVAQFDLLSIQPPEVEGKAFFKSGVLHTALRGASEEALILVNEHFINRFLLTDRQSAIALRDTSLHVAFLAYESLNARESIVNLKGVAVSSGCYNTSMSNECSSPLGSVTRISDLIWLTKLRYDRGELCNAELMMHLRDQQLPLRWCYFWCHYPSLFLGMLFQREICYAW